MAEIKTKSELLAAAIFFGDKEIEIEPKLETSKGKWLVKRELSAKFKMDSGRAIEVVYNARAKRFEMIVESGYGRSVLFYEDEIPLILEANEIIKEMRKNKKLTKTDE